jgi:hypothetical protein
VEGPLDRHPAVEFVDGVHRRGVAGEQRRDRGIHHLVLAHARLAGEGGALDLDLEVPAP